MIHSSALVSTFPTGSRSRTIVQPTLCQLCGIDEVHSEHHLIPRHCHRKKWWKRTFTREQMRQTILLCKMCHNSVHDLIPDEKELGREYYTVEKLISHPAIAKYLAWKQRRVRD